MSAPTSTQPPPPVATDPSTDDEASGASADDVPTLNTVELVRAGTIKTLKNKTAEPYTILLVGETGTGKSSVLELIANVLGGNPVFKYDFNILSKENEAGGSQSGSQTNEARLYEIKSVNGQMVRILDTPGLADTRGLQQDEIHKRSIATQIRKYIDSVNAVIILANGTVPRITVGTDYALSTLSSIFPKTLAHNMGFLFTNVPSPLAWNFSQDTVPEVLKDAPQFLLDNPIALQKKYDKLVKDPKQKNLKEIKAAVVSGEERALRMLVDVFDWLDGLTPQPTTEILSLYDMSQSIEQQITNTLAQMEQATLKKKDVAKLLTDIQSGNASMSAFSQYEQRISTTVWKQQDSTYHNTLCSETACYRNCHEHCALNFSLDPSGLKGCAAMTGDRCHVCNHSLWSHHHYRVLWKQVADSQVSVDSAMKSKWQSAKTDKERNEAALAALQATLDNLTKGVDDGTSKLASLASDYAGLALSGSFSAQIEKAITLLEQKMKSMQDSGVDSEQLKKVGDSLNLMRQKLDLLKEANAKAKKDKGGIINIVFNAITGK